MVETDNDDVEWTVYHPCSSWTREYLADAEIDR